MPAVGDGASVAMRTTTGELAQRLGARLVGPPDLSLRRLDTLDRADRETLTFIRDEAFAKRWADSAAGAAIVTDGLEPSGHDPAARALLVVADADRALIAVLEALAPPHVPPPEGVHLSAVVDPTAEVAASAAIGPGAVVGARCSIGEGARIGPNVVLGAGVRVGAGADLRAGVVVQDRCAVGARTVLHPSVVVGADGFGYRPGEDGASLIKVPHAGHVEIGDDVEVGAGTTIDRGKLGPTVVGDGTKIDNLVQIGHNCRIGRSCIICGAAALAGSVTLGDGVIIGGGAGVRDNVTLGDGVRLGAFSGVRADIAPGETWVGAPARPQKETMRILAAVNSLPTALKEFRKRLSALENANK